MKRRNQGALLAACGLLLTTVLANAQGAPQPAPLGAPPTSSAFPHVEFAFEFQVALSAAVVLGDTPYGHRQYISIAGGKIAGPKLTGEVLPGGWDYQLGLANGCSVLSADYFIRGTDGTIIHVLNEGTFCRPEGPNGARSFFRPRFEAPKGPNEWLNRSTFVASLEVAPPTTPAASGGAPAPGGIRLKFYQVE
jgi:Protein of unknown function (DUF3237)